MWLLYIEITAWCIEAYKIYAKQKQPGAVQKGTAKQSRINTITKYDW